MNILITGGTGFIGSALCSRLVADQHNVVVLSRDPTLISRPLSGISSLSQLNENDVFDAVINLAGEPIAEKTWRTRQKQRIWNSRIDTTEAVVDYLSSLRTKPEVLISGSAVGYYGVGKDSGPIVEGAQGDNSFSSMLCRDWESKARRAESFGVRTCLLRTGIVLGKRGGALGKMLLPFKLGLGGKIGDGKHWMPWIHLNDLIDIILFCITHSRCTGPIAGSITEPIAGPINATAPNAVTNQEFTCTLGKVLNRPTFFTMPAAAIKMLMGQMGEELLLSGKQVYPEAISQAGYNFKYEHLKDALSDILEK
ncbi:MAG: TIGR01777 family protein [Gammaproteobacteria bacterium]|nr:TIGR01777 family protein [Gammaproteobacteria bacterium]